MLRFRNDRTGYVRSYRVVTAENKTDAVSGVGIDVYPSYYREYTSHILQRIDSTGNSDNKELEFCLATDNSVKIKSRYRIGPSSIELAVPEVEDGTEVLSHATFAGRTYPTVLGRSITLAGARPSVVLTLYVTKVDGLIRFEERGGTVWNRL